MAERRGIIKSIKASDTVMNMLIQIDLFKPEVLNSAQGIIPNEKKVLLVFDPDRMARVEYDVGKDLYDVDIIKCEKECISEKIENIFFDELGGVIYDKLLKVTGKK